MVSARANGFGVPFSFLLGRRAAPVVFSVALRARSFWWPCPPPFGGLRPPRPPRLGRCGGRRGSPWAAVPSARARVRPPRGLGGVSCGVLSRSGLTRPSRSARRVVFLRLATQSLTVGRLPSLCHNRAAVRGSALPPRFSRGRPRYPCRSAFDASRRAAPGFSRLRLVPQGLLSGSPVSARSPLARRRRGPPAAGLLWSSLAPFIARRAAAVAGVPSLGRCARPAAAAVAAMPPSPLRRARALPSPLALLGRAASRSATLRSSPRALRPLPLPPRSALSRPVRLPSAGSVGLRPPSPAALVTVAAGSPPRLALRRSFFAAARQLYSGMFVPWLGYSFGALGAFVGV